MIVLSIVLSIISITLQTLILLRLRALNILKPRTKSTLPKGINPINPNTTVRECQFCGSLNGVQKSNDGYFACNVCRATKLGIVNQQATH